MGIEWRKSATLGVLLNTRGLIELVVLNIGLELGILSPAIFSMLFLMALATTMMTSPLVGWLLRTSPAAVGQPMVLYPITHLQLPRSPVVLNEHPAMLSVPDGARNNVGHGGESTPRRAGFTRNDRQN